jgi:hypothetical protein
MQRQSIPRPNRLLRKTPTSRAARIAFSLVTAFAAIGLPAAARALTIDVGFTSSTYQVQAADTYADLLAQHQAGALLGASSVTSLADVSTAIYAPGVTADYSMLMRIVLDVAQTGLYEFQVGVDWGRGGVAAVIDDSNGQVVSEYVRTDDLWWANDWSNPDVFSTQVTLTQGGSYTLDWIGFEDCCAGASTVRFSFDGGAFQTLDSATFDPYAVPEPGSLVLLAIGLVGLRAYRSRPA